jgi:hypothetical protein
MSHEADALFMKSIMEEMNHFQNELNELKTRCASVKFEVGTKAEQQQLRKGTDSIKNSDLKSSMHVSRQLVLFLSGVLVFRLIFYGRP